MKNLVGNIENNLFKNLSVDRKKEFIECFVRLNYKSTVDNRKVLVSMIEDLWSCYVETRFDIFYFMLNLKKYMQKDECFAVLYKFVENILKIENKKGMIPNHYAESFFELLLYVVDNMSYYTDCTVDLDIFSNGIYEYANSLNSTDVNIPVLRQKLGILMKKQTNTALTVQVNDKAFKFKTSGLRKSDFEDIVNNIELYSEEDRVKIVKYIVKKEWNEMLYDVDTFILYDIGVLEQGVFKSENPFLSVFPINSYRGTHRKSHTLLEWYEHLGVTSITEFKELFVEVCKVYNSDEYTELLWDTLLNRGGEYLSTTNTVNASTYSKEWYDNYVEYVKNKTDYSLFKDKRVTIKEMGEVREKTVKYAKVGNTFEQYCVGCKKEKYSWISNYMDLCYLLGGLPELDIDLSHAEYRAFFVEAEKEGVHSGYTLGYSPIGNYILKYADVETLLGYLDSGMIQDYTSENLYKKILERLFSENKVNFNDRNHIVAYFNRKSGVLSSTYLKEAMVQILNENEVIRTSCVSMLGENIVEDVENSSMTFRELELIYIMVCMFVGVL